MVLEHRQGRGPPRAPCVAILTQYRVKYVGRAEAHGKGDVAVVVAKADGSLIVHDPARGVKPLYYNPAGRQSSWQRLDRWFFRSTSSSGEMLTVSGHPVALVPDGSDAGQRERRVRRTERELSNWLASKPAGVPLPRGVPDREALAGGGRVDLLFPDGTVVEVKKRATVAAFDQAQRYLRGGAPRIIIATLHASPALRRWCCDSTTIELLLLPAHPSE